MKEKETQKIKLIKRIGKTKDGKEFDSYKLVKENGKLVDAHFKKDCNMSVFADGNKFELEAGYVQHCENYEFPRVYIGDIKEDSIKKIY